MEARDQKQDQATVGDLAFYNGKLIGKVAWKDGNSVVLTNPVFPGPHGADRFEYRPDVDALLREKEGKG